MPIIQNGINLSDVTAILTSLEPLNYILTESASEIATLYNDSIILSKQIYDINNILIAGDAASIIDSSNLLASKAASIINSSDLLASKAASIFESTNLSISKSASIFESTNLSISQINSILIHDNISDSRAQAILNGTSYANRDLISATSILYSIHDDFADSKLISRDTRATTAATTLAANEFSQSFRPEWTQTGTAYTSSTAKVNQVNVGTATDRLLVSSTFIVGTWEISYTRINTGANFSVFFLMGSDYQNGYGIVVYHGGTDLYLTEWTANTPTNVIVGTWANDASAHVLKATRDGSGNFELFQDAVSKGTGTDTTTNTSTVLGFRNYGTSSGQCSWDTMKVY